MTRFRPNETAFVPRAPRPAPLGEALGVLAAVLDLAARLTRACQPVAQGRSLSGLSIAQMRVIWSSAIWNA
jgi:hypothetical protein